MRTIGRYAGAGRTVQGELTITFAIDDDIQALEKLENFKGADLIIETQKYYEKKSLNANAYFWVLCTKIAHALNSDKDTVYLLQLSKYGLFIDVMVIPEAVEALRHNYRWVEPMETYGDMVSVRCYIGSSNYDKAEMARLIDGTVQDAKDLNIDTWTRDEIERVLASWKPSWEGKK